MDVQVDALRLAKKSVKFEVGDVVVWNKTPYLVVSQPRYCLLDVSGEFLANGNYDSLEELLHHTNRLITTPEDRRDIKVYPKDQFMFELVRR